MATSSISHRPNSPTFPGIICFFIFLGISVNIVLRAKKRGFEWNGVYLSYSEMGVVLAPNWNGCWRHHRFCNKRGRDVNDDVIEMELFQEDQDPEEDFTDCQKARFNCVSVNCQAVDVGVFKVFRYDQFTGMTNFRIPSPRVLRHWRGRGEGGGVQFNPTR